MRASSQVLDRIAVTFDDEHAVASAGLILPATVSGKLGLEVAGDELVGVGHRRGRKVATVVDAMLAGGDCIDDVDILRAGATQRIVGHEVVARRRWARGCGSSRSGTYASSTGSPRRCLRGRGLAAPGPGDAPLVVDVDSTICEVHGYAKQGAAFGYTRQRGLHPMAATRADTGEVVHARQRTGSANTARGAPRFVRETIGRVRRAGATGQTTLRHGSAISPRARWSPRPCAAATWPSPAG